MAVSNFFQYARRALFSAPTPERQLLKLAKERHARRVVELGIDSLETTTKLVKQIAEQSGGIAATYTGFDAFDERPASEEPLTLIQAHRQLSAVGSSIRLQPGGPTLGVPLLANSLQDTDLVLISSTADEQKLSPVWYYLPRMCHPGTLVLQRQPGSEEASEGDWTPITLEEVSRFASLPSLPKAA